MHRRLQRDRDGAVAVSLYHYDPSVDQAPRFQAFSVPMTRGMRVLDVLDYIYKDLDHPFAYRWFCGTKRCGRCAVTVNGKAVLACWEPAQPVMRIEPLRHFPVVRDLVVDFSEAEKRLTAMRPLLERSRDYPGFPEPITHETMMAAFDLMVCIDCRVCVGACDALERSPDSGFAGPAAFVQLASVVADPRNDVDRSTSIMKGYIDQCHSCNDCTHACPNGIEVLEGAMDLVRTTVIDQGLYRVPLWGTIRKMPPGLRALIHCRLGLSSPTKIVRRE